MIKDEQRHSVPLTNKWSENESKFERLFEVQIFKLCLTSLGLSLLLLLTLAKTAYANKVTDFTAPFMKNLASKMQLMYVVA